MPYSSFNVQNFTSINNSTTAILDSGGIYTGTIDMVEQYSTVILSIISDVASAIYGISIQFSQDNSNWDIIEMDTYDIVGIPYIKYILIKAKFFRIKYTNGSSAQSYFRLQTIISANIKMSAAPIQKITFAENTQDAFSRLRVSEPVTLFDMTHIVGPNTILMDQKLTGDATATHNPNDSTMILSTTTNGDRVIRQSRRSLPYQPGKSLLSVQTSVLNSGGSNGANVTSRVGYYNDSNGVFFQYKNSVISVGLRSKSTGTVVDLIIPSTQWNIDRLDGTGLSGIVINPSKAQIFMIDLQWLGVGTVRCAFNINSVIYYVHQFHHANIAATTYMATATLPVRYEIIADGADATGSMLEICASVVSEGGYQPLGIAFSISNTAFVDIDIADERPLIAIRLKSGREEATVQMLKLSLLNSNKGDTNYKIRIYRHISTLTDLFTEAITFTSIDSDSSVEYNLAPSFLDADPTINDNNIIIDGFATSVQGATIDKLERTAYLSSDIDGVRDIAVLTAIALTANNEKVFGSLSWSEFI